MKWRSLAQSSNESNIIHRLDPRVKIFLLIITGFIIVFLDNPMLLAVLLALGIGGMLAAKLSYLKIKVTAVVILLGLWGAMFSQSLFYEQIPRTAILTVVSPDTPFLGTWTKGIYIYQEGALHGLRQGLRMAAMTTLGLLMCWTTDARLLLLGLVRLRMPYGIAFMTVTAVRFIPVLMQEAAQVITASKMRGGKKISLKLLSPILANSLRRAGVLAVAVESRAFRSQVHRTYLEDLRFSIGEKIFLSAYLLIAISIVITKTSYFFYQYGVYYSSNLRPVYEIAKTYL